MNGRRVRRASPWVRGVHHLGIDLAEVYDTTAAAISVPAVVDPTVDLLVELADGGPVLEFAVGTGRIALPLSRRGVGVTGIELSPHMTDQLRRKPGAEQVPVTSAT